MTNNGIYFEENILASVFPVTLTEAEYFGINAMLLRGNPL